MYITVTQFPCALDSDISTLSSRKNVFAKRLTI